VSRLPPTRFVVGQKAALDQRNQQQHSDQVTQVTH
jgi:hypothetical protein